MDELTYRTDRWDDGFNRTTGDTAVADPTSDDDLDDFVQAWRYVDGV